MQQNISVEGMAGVDLFKCGSEERFSRTRTMRADRVARSGPSVETLVMVRVMWRVCNMWFRLSTSLWQ